jgi:hypothetical protein
LHFRKSALSDLASKLRVREQPEHFRVAFKTGGIRPPVISLRFLSFPLGLGRLDVALARLAQRNPAVHRNSSQLKVEPLPSSWGQAPPILL